MSEPPLSIHNVCLESFHCHHYYCLLWHIYNGETHFLWLTASSFPGVQSAKECMCARCKLRETHPSYESWPTKPDRKPLRVTHRTHQIYLLFIHFSVCLYFLHFTFRMQWFGKPCLGLPSGWMLNIHNSNCLERQESSSLPEVLSSYRSRFLLWATSRHWSINKEKIYVNINDGSKGILCSISLSPFYFKASP